MFKIASKQKTLKNKGQISDVSRRNCNKKLTLLNSYFEETLEGIKTRSINIIKEPSLFRPKFLTHAIVLIEEARDFLPAILFGRNSMKV